MYIHIEDKQALYNILFWQEVALSQECDIYIYTFTNLEIGCTPTIFCQSIHLLA